LKAALMTLRVGAKRHQRQVGECLREVAQGLAARAGLLGVEPQMVGVGQHALEDQPRLGAPLYR
jgi:hypothetical protein